MVNNRFSNKQTKYDDVTRQQLMSSGMLSESDDVDPVVSMTSTETKSTPKNELGSASKPTLNDLLDDIPASASKSKYMTIYLKESIITKLKKEAKSRNMTTSKLIATILDKML